MPGPLALGLTAAGGIADYLGASSAQRQQQRNFKAALAAYQKALKKGKKLFRKERGALMAALGLADEEFKRPEAALASQGRQFSRDFRRAEERQLGDVKLLAQRGGLSPTMLRFLQQQSAADIGREGRRAYADLAGARASVQSQRAGSKLGLQRDIAGTFANQAAFGLRGAEGLVQNVLGAAQPTYSPVGGALGSLGAYFDSLREPKPQAGLTPGQQAAYARTARFRFR